MNWQVRNPRHCTTDGCTAKAEIEALRSRAAGDASEKEHLLGSIVVLREKVAALALGITFWDTTFIEAREGYESQLAAMTKERDTLNAALDAKITICGDANLAIAQARIVELREALDRLGHHEICHESCEVCKLLATPDDSSALDAALEEAYSQGYADDTALMERLAQEYDKGYQDAKDKYGDLT